nr:SUN domain-containing protein 2 isoform X2 [Panthera onca]
MSRRSQRLTRYSQGDDDGGSSSGGSSVMGSQSTLFKDSPLRTLKRKSANMKRLSPAPQLGPSSDTHTSYYSESVVRESYFGSPRAASLARSSILDDQLHSDPYWGEDLRVRRRRGTGGTESSKLNGLSENKGSEDFLGSSSGYSSEDDYAGYSESDHRGSGSRLRNAASWAASFFWMVVTSPGRLFGLLYWWVGTTWYRLTTAASLLDVFVLTRRFSSVKTFLWFLLLLLLLTGLTYGKLARCCRAGVERACQAEMELVSQRGRAVWVGGLALSGHAKTRGMVIAYRQRKRQDEWSQTEPGQLSPKLSATPVWPSWLLLDLCGICRVSSG